MLYILIRIDLYLATVHVLNGSFANEKVNIGADLDRSNKRGLIEPIRVELISANRGRGSDAAIDQVVRLDAMLGIVNAGGKIIISIGEAHVDKTRIRTLRTLAQAIKRVQHMRDLIAAPP